MYACIRVRNHRHWTYLSVTSFANCAAVLCSFVSCNVAFRYQFITEVANCVSHSNRCATLLYTYFTENERFMMRRLLLTIVQVHFIQSISGPKLSCHRVTAAAAADVTLVHGCHFIWTVGCVYYLGMVCLTK